MAFLHKVIFTVLVYFCVVDSFFFSFKQQNVRDLEHSKTKRSCLDLDYRCPTWASQGQCTKSPVYMRQACMASCKVCQIVYSK